MRQARGRAGDLIFAARFFRHVSKLYCTRVGRQAIARWARMEPASHGAVRRLARRIRAPAPDPVMPAYGSTAVVDGLEMRIDERMSPQNIRRLLAGNHTRDERQLVERILEPGDVVMELGGGIGMVSIACARKIGSGRVFSFEANPRLEPLIRGNYALNGVSPTLSLCMLGPERGKRSLHLARQFSQSTTLSPSSRAYPWLGRRRSGEVIEVPVAPLDDALERIRPTVLIVDIEGGEKELLAKADLATVRKVVIELHPQLTGISSAIAVRSRLRGLGFHEEDRIGLNFLYLRRPEPWTLS